MQPQDITALFDKWNQALQSGDPKTVTALYATDAILLPTISNQVRHNHEEIEDYFVTFLANDPVGTMVEQNIRIYDELAINSGVYDFSFKDGSTVRGRYNFVYQLINGDWQIIEHHSSRMPE